MRLLCADHHPDHDSICTFSRENRALLAGSVHQVLETAVRLRVLRGGDPESRIMKTGAGFAQAYNAQAAVEVESRLLVSQAVIAAPNDKAQLEPTLTATSPAIKSIATVLVDSGFTAPRPWPPSNAGATGSLARQCMRPPTASPTDAAWSNSKSARTHPRPTPARAPPP